ncbi:hypothetical protein QVD17_07437 [Tagetes erecta]|uniref:AT-hook motif nuclear-localized protein n=1 Tax=Tagetes erecta TaxID=13708 RepID=A0AAD8PC17_TARER|nr:hypothetical protein QVD17_07437 [Tagetes erecta]
MEEKDDTHDHVSGDFISPPPPPPPLPAAAAAAVFSGADGLKKKRGRPRKYGADGKPTVTLSPMPISASIPLTGDYDYPGWKKIDNKPLTSIKRKQKLNFCTPGEHVAYTVGPNFTPHVLTVNSGEDVNMKIISFAQQGSKAICVLAANGAISNVTLRQPNSSGGTLTYEGRFDILSLSGAFTSNNIGGAKGVSGGMSVSLAGPDGRVLGGSLAGMLVAASPIQVILGSFLPGHQHEPENPKKSRFEPVFKETTERAHGDQSNISFTLTNPINVSRGIVLENNGSLHASEPEVVNSSVFGVSC